MPEPPPSGKGMGERRGWFGFHLCRYLRLLGPRWDFDWMRTMSNIPTDLVVTSQQWCSGRDSLGTEMGWWFSFSRPELCALPCKLEVGRWRYVLLPPRENEVVGGESPVLFLTKLYSSSDKRPSKAGMDWFLTLFSMEEDHAPYQLVTSHVVFLNGTVSRSFIGVLSTKVNLIFSIKIQTRGSELLKSDLIFCLIFW